MQIEQYMVGPLGTNCYLLTCKKTGVSALVDPGGISAGIVAAVKKASVEKILLTHGHFDHTEGVPHFLETTGASLYIHEHDAALLTDDRLSGAMLFGTPVKIDAEPVLMGNGDTITVGEESVRVIHTPGHTRGSVVFVCGNECVLSGDTLFRMSVGRCDLPGGDYTSLIRSLATLFKALPDEMPVYPGHGEATTIGFERRANPFLRG